VAQASTPASYGGVPPPLELGRAGTALEPAGADACATAFLSQYSPIFRPYGQPQKRSSKKRLFSRFKNALYYK